MSTTIKLRGGTAANWSSVNPVLAVREMVVETDTFKLKIGDGTTTYNSLPYVESGAPTTNPNGGANNYAPINNPTFIGPVSMNLPGGAGGYFSMDGDVGDILLNNDTGVAYSNSVLESNDNSNRIATTEFVKSQIQSYAPLESPAFTGVTSGVRSNIINISSLTTLSLLNDIIIISGSRASITLPTAVDKSGKKYIFKNKLLSTLIESTLTCTGVGSKFVMSGDASSLNLIAGDRIQIVGDVNVYTVISVSGVDVNVSSSVSFASGSSFYLYHQIKTSLSETIDGTTDSPMITAYENKTIVSDGSNWIII